MSKHPVYHSGELYLQKQSGVEAKADKLAKMMVVDFLSEQQQQFYPLLNTIFVASVDTQDKPWASIIMGAPGFLTVPDHKHLKINAQPLAGDCLIDNIKHNQYLGFLGLEYHSRRRNRIAGELIEHNDQGLLIKVQQAFGNCPKYIQARKAIVSNNSNHHPDNDVEEFSQMNDACKELIEQADTFFIASYHPDAEQKGADISHRGGKPGFVSIENNDTLAFDDYRGNNMYMTLGNLYTHPHAGLLFINYETGDLWQLQADAEIIETFNETNTRKIQLTIKQVRKLSSALSIEWNFLEYSPYLI